MHCCLSGSFSGISLLQLAFLHIEEAVMSSFRGLIPPPGVSESEAAIASRPRRLPPERTSAPYPPATDARVPVPESQRSPWSHCQAHRISFNETALPQDTGSTYERIISRRRRTRGTLRSETAASKSVYSEQAVCPPFDFFSPQFIRESREGYRWRLDHRAEPSQRGTKPPAARTRPLKP